MSNVLNECQTQYNILFCVFSYLKQRFQSIDGHNAYRDLIADYTNLIYIDLGK